MIRVRGLLRVLDQETALMGRGTTDEPAELRSVPSDVLEVSILKTTLICNRYNDCARLYVTAS